MSIRCFISNKGKLIGNKKSHAQNKTKRVFYPNLHKKRIMLEDGSIKRVKVSTSALRNIKKEK